MKKVFQSGFPFLTLPFEILLPVPLPLGRNKSDYLFCLSGGILFPCWKRQYRSNFNFFALLVTASSHYSGTVDDRDFMVKENHPRTALLCLCVKPGRVSLTVEKSTSVRYFPTVTTWVDGLGSPFYLLYCMSLCILLSSPDNKRLFMRISIKYHTGVGVVVVCVCDGRSKCFYLKHTV